MRLRWKLLQHSGLVVVTSFYALGAIRPSFDVDDCAWNATDIVVLAPEFRAETFSVLETIKGELAPGASIELPGLTPAQSNTARLGELAKGDFEHPFEALPPVEESDRLIVFLRRPASTSPWQPASKWGDFRVSAVWIQDGVAYGFLQTMNPGPTHLTELGMNEAQLRESVDSVLQIRGAMDHAVANADPVERSRELAALVRSEKPIVKMSAIERLKRGGAAEAHVLVGLVSDESLLGWHQDFVGALVAMHAAGVPFAQFLNEETNYWFHVCGTLSPGWWNRPPYSDFEIAKNHYTRAHALLMGIHELAVSEAKPAVRDFASAWSTCPPAGEREEKDQITAALGLLLER